MKKLISALGFATVAVVAGIAFFGPTKKAEAACYSNCSVVQVQCADGSTDVVTWGQRNLACGQKNNAGNIVSENTKKPSVQKQKKIITIETARAAPVSEKINWKSVRPNGVCGVGREAPAVDLGNNLTFTCDTQAGTGGYNLKPKGAAKPIYGIPTPGSKCVFRLAGGAENATTFTKACKLVVTHIAETNNGVLVKTSWFKRSLVFKISGTSAKKL